uniref:Uncharacterized protein n=1 Tax=Ditylenchus dipsaci TaxID=166011 RepID=A0A915DYU7_9BILA
MFVAPPPLLNYIAQGQAHIKARGNIYIPFLFNNLQRCVKTQVIPDDPIQIIVTAAFKRIKKLEAKRNRWSFLPTKLRTSFAFNATAITRRQAHIVAIHNAKIKSTFKKGVQDEQLDLEDSPFISKFYTADEIMIDDEEKTKKHERKEGETLNIVRQKTAGGRR